MKNRFTLLAGFMFVITFLIAGTSGNRTDTTKDRDDKTVVQTQEPKTVTITIKAIEIDGEMHLILEDSHDNWGVDCLVTGVFSEGRVEWVLGENSGIRQIKNIKSQLTTRELPVIFENEPSQIRKDKFRLDLEHIPPGCKAVEKYYIEVILEDGTTLRIDPHLEIPPP